MYELSFLSTAKAGVDSGHGLEGRRALFLSVQGGGAETDPVTKREWEGQITISYVIPVKHIGEYNIN